MASFCTSDFDDCVVLDDLIHSEQQGLDRFSVHLEKSHVIFLQSVAILSSHIHIWQYFWLGINSCPEGISSFFQFVHINFSFSVETK